MAETSLKSILCKRLVMFAYLPASWDRMISRERELDSLWEHGLKLSVAKSAWGMGARPPQITGLGE